MTDIFETNIVCPDCKIEAGRGQIVREGFRIRLWKCPQCSKIWQHPADQKEYEDFQKLKQREFHVKLRMVGNSYAVSIPREIIQFEEEFRNIEMQFQKEFERMVRLCLEEPGKLSLFFNDQGEQRGNDKKRRIEVHKNG